jgi:outer membrane protein insertion porin family
LSTTLRSRLLLIVVVWFCATAALASSVFAQGESPEEPEETTFESGLTPDAEQDAPSEDNVTVELVEGVREGMQIGAITFDCIGAICDQPARVTDFVELLGFPPDGVISRALLREAGGRLLETGFFSSVHFTCTPGRDGRSNINVDVTDALLIRHVRLRTQAALASELRRRVFLRSGSVWTDDETVRARQEEALREYFEQRGYFGSQIRLRPQLREELSLVDLDFDIERGRRRAVNNVYLRGTTVLDYEEVRELLIGEFDLLRTFTTRRFDRAQRAVVGRYRSLGYIQARVILDETRELDGGLVDLFVDIREGPRWRIRFEGDRLFSEAELLRRLAFYRTGFIDAAELRLSAREVASMYETRGHYFATVEVTQGEGDDYNENSLLVTIDEGPASALRGIEFVGISGLDTAEVAAALGSQVYDVLSPGGYLQRSVLDSDLRTIVAMYRARGYLRAQPTRTVVQRGADSGDLFLSIHVSEGDPTQVSEVTYEEAGDIEFNTEQMLVTPGAPFVPADLEADRTTLLRAAREQGYALAHVSFTCTDPSGATIDCTSFDTNSACLASPDTDRDEACARGVRGGFLTEECILVPAEPACLAPEPLPSIAVHWSIEPGARAVFGNVFIRGNFETRRSVIRREFRMRGGEAFDPELLLRAQSDLRSLGIFDAVRVNTIWHPDPRTGGDAASLLVQVEESRSRSFDHRVGLEARIASAGDALLILSNEPSFRDINFLGRGEELRVSGNVDFDVVDLQRVRDDEFRAGMSVVLFDPRFWLWGLIDDAWEARNEVVWRYDLLAQAPAPLRRSIEFSSRVREEFRSVRGLSFEFGLSLRRTRTADQSGVGDLDRIFESALILSLSPRITLDRRDSPLNPTRGTFSQLEFEVADDLFGVLASRRFTRVTSRFSGFVPIRGDLVFGASVRVGAAAGGLFDGLRESGTYALPLSERFALGGVTSLRGFAEGVITPDGTEEFGGDVVLNGSVELRYPFVRSFGIDGAIFVDWGQLTQAATDLELDGFRYSTGFGVRWLIADLVPLVIDYGAVLGRRPGERPGRLHFNIGYTF